MIFLSRMVIAWNRHLHGDAVLVVEGFALNRTVYFPAAVDGGIPATEVKEIGNPASYLHFGSVTSL